MISINKNRATTPALSSVLFELGDRAMPTKTLCPKSHGQRTITCPVCNGSGGTCFAEVVVGICGQCHGGGQCRCDVCGGAPEVEPETLQRWSSEHHSADENCASPGRRLLRRTVSELRLKGQLPRAGPREVTAFGGGETSLSGSAAAIANQLLS